MREIITLLGGRKDVREEMIGTGGMIQRNKMKIQEMKRMTSLQIVMIQVPQISIEVTVPVG